MPDNNVESFQIMNCLTSIIHTPWDHHLPGIKHDVAHKSPSLHKVHKLLNRFLHFWHMYINWLKNIDFTVIHVLFRNVYFWILQLYILL
jgi:hypothetical protein